MACPYFVPTEKIAEAVDGCRVRPPLGALYKGFCAAGEEKIEPPDAETLDRRCNFGYARPVCGHFPADPGPDAVRFSVTKDDGRRVRMLFSMERDHRPFRNGRIEFDRDGDSWTGVETDTILYDQAQAYLRSYLSWRSRSSTL